MNGGTDDPDNLITLCESCHMEWTHVVPDVVPFDDWMNLPPAGWLIALLDNEAIWTTKATAAELRTFLLLSFNDEVVRRRDAE